MKIGELARRTGLTVRALHHYEAIGLLVARRRTAAGHRVYTAEDLARLQRIVSLKALGFPLEQIGACLARPHFDLARVVDLHLSRLDAAIEAQSRLRERLWAVRASLAAGEEVSVDALLGAIEESVNMEKYYTPAQLEALAARREALGEDGMLRAQQDWAGLIAEVDTLRKAGVPAHDARLAPLVARWRALILAFTGGDTGITTRLHRAYETEGPERASRGALDAALFTYVQEAMAAFPS